MDTLVQYIKSFLKNETSLFISDGVCNCITIKKNRSCICEFQNLKLYFTLPKKTPKYEGYFVILYKIVNRLSTPLLVGDVDYIVITLRNGFYLIPLLQMPLNKKKQIFLRGLRVYDRDPRFEKYFYNY